MSGSAVTDVADLRSAPELERHGKGLVPDGVTIHHLPFVETLASDADAPHENAFQKMLTEKADDESVSDAAGRYMTEEYQRIARSPLAQRAVHKVVTMLGDGDRVLAHCFAGKDRTGFTIAMVLEAAGVDRDAVMADFLASNAAVPELRAHIVEDDPQPDVGDPRGRRGGRSAADRCGARRAGGLPRFGAARDHRRTSAR